MSYYKKQILHFLFLFTIGTMLFAQDPLLSEYDASEVLLNPALTGVFKESERTAFNFRSQWASLGSKITTTAMAYDLPLNERWGFGGYMLYSDGTGIFNNVNFVLSGAADISKEGQDVHNMSVGMQLGFIYKSVGTLLFDNQYNEKLGYFNANAISGENITQFNRWMHDVNIGFNYHYDDDTRLLNPYFGFSLFHVTSPKEYFLVDGTDANLPRRWVFYGGTFIHESEHFDIKPNVLYMLQGQASQLLFGLDLVAHYKNNLMFLGGVSYRLNDAIIPKIGFHYKKFEYTLSYDITVSKLSNFTNGRGALEMTVVLLNK